MRERRDLFAALQNLSNSQKAFALLEVPAARDPKNPCRRHKLLQPLFADLPAARTMDANSGPSPFPHVDLKGKALVVLDVEGQHFHLC